MGTDLSKKVRCKWVTADPLYIRYHDREWGVPVRKDQKLFEHLCLENAQAGLSWLTVLKKRENYREAFANFEPEKVARYTAKNIDQLMQNTGLIRNRAKLNAAVNNAKCFLADKKNSGVFTSTACNLSAGRG